jgi:hypothetical protein
LNLEKAVKWSKFTPPSPIKLPPLNQPAIAISLVIGKLLAITIHFLSNFWEVNKRLIRKPFSIPKISTVLQELEGFTFAMALGLKMGYYTIRLDPDASRICTVIFPWGKYSYKRLPMGIAGSPKNFQSKMSELMEDLEYVRAYLDDFLCISRSSLEDHLK